MKVLLLSLALAQKPQVIKRTSSTNDAEQVIGSWSGFFLGRNGSALMTQRLPRSGEPWHSDRSGRCFPD